MSARRAAAPPPEIAGFDAVSTIGSGGFSDVYCYEQRRPRRRVAIKVLLQEWSTPEQRAAFDAEADLLAQLSTHPSIVTMYEAAVSADGRPYLAMEYCSRPGMGSRYRSERMPVAEVLRTAVLVAGAVETVHRAGILHRDIKPANILVTDYGHPVLTDFGISSTVDQVGGADGMSIPWSPPESFDETPTSGVATDVWALAATTYSLLAGRSPFEVPGGANGSADLIHRISTTAVPATGRSDVPASLERVLATAMAKSPRARYPSALALARALQRVESELALAVTPIDVLDDDGRVHQHAEPTADPDDGESTRLRQVVTIDPDAVTRPPSRRGAGGTAVGAAAATFAAVGATTEPADEATALRSPAGAGPGGGSAGGSARVATPTPTHASAPEWTAPPGSASADDTVHRGAVSTPVQPGTAGGTAPDRAAPSGQGGGVRRAVWSLVAVVVIGGGVVAGVVFRPDATADEPRAEETVDPGEFAVMDNLGDLVPSVAELAGTVEGETATFTWENPDGEEGDTFAVEILDPVEQHRPELVAEPEVEIPADASGETCVSVSVVRDGKRSASPQKACAEVAE